MPTVAVVDGMKIQFFAAEHPPPHFHVALAEYRAQIEIRDLRLLRGGLPPAKLSAVLSWAQPRRAVLLATWERVVGGGSPGKIV